MKKKDNKLLVGCYLSHQKAIPLIVDYNIDIINYYLYKIRRLKDTDIQYNKITLSYYESSYEYQQMSAEELLSGVFVSHRDAEIISTDADDYERFLDNFLLEYREVLTLFGKSPTLIEESNLLLKTFKTIQSTLSKPKKMKKLYKSYVMQHPVITNSINDYLTYLSMIKEKEEMAERYRHLIAENTPID